MEKVMSLVDRVRMMRGPKRRMAIWTALALIAGVLAISTVQLGAEDGNESAAGVHPTEVNLGGQPNDCDATVGGLPSNADYELRIENPQTGAYSTPEGVTIDLVVIDDELLNFDVSGAVVYDVVIKGGKKSTLYDYDGSSVGAVTADNDLRAPKKGNKFFSISHTSFCYSTGFPVSGLVYFDNDQSGDFGEGDVPESGRKITAYLGGVEVESTTSSASSASAGTYGMILDAIEGVGTYTICEAKVVVSTKEYAQTVPINENCKDIGAPLEVGGYDGINGPRAGLDFGNAPEVCGQRFSLTSVTLSGTFELFANGNEESGCDNKSGQLFFSDGGAQINLPLVGPGEVAGIGVITKEFGEPPSFVPLRYSQGPDDLSFEVLPWCVLRDKGDDDGTQFDTYLPSGKYPSLKDVKDPDSNDASVSCKVAEKENAEGTQETVVLIQDDPFWR